jgi:hypothetical protein
MKKLTILSLGLIGTIMQGQQIDWSVGAPYKGIYSYETAVVTDKQNNVYLGGLHANYPEYKPFLIKYDNAGVLQWECISTYGGIRSLAVDGNNNLYSCYSQLVKWDSNGNVVWNKPGYLTLNEESDINDQIVAAGDVNGKTIISKYDENGSCNWSQEESGAFTNSCYNRNRNETVYELIFGDDSLVLNKALPTQRVFYKNKGTGVIAKYDNKGKLLWAKQTSASWPQIDNDGNVYVLEWEYVYGAPTLEGKTKIVKYDLNGNVLWKRCPMLIDGWYKGDMAIMDEGSLILSVGYSDSAIIDGQKIPAKIGVSRILVAKIDSVGKLLWCINSDGKGSAGTKDVHVREKNIYVAGDFSGEVSLGGTTVSQPDGGTFLFKISDVNGITGLDESVSNSVRLFPNPSSGLILIDNKQTINRVVVFNASGQQVYEGKLTDQPPYSIDINFLPKGIYLLQIYTGEVVETKKVVLH